MALDKTTLNHITLALGTKKFDDKFTESLIDIIHNSDVNALEKTVAYFIEGAPGLSLQGMENSKTVPTTYTGITTYRTALVYALNKDLYRFIKADQQAHF